MKIKNRITYIVATILYKLHEPWFDNYMTKLDIGAGDLDTLHDLLA